MADRCVRLPVGAMRAHRKSRGRSMLERANQLTETCNTVSVFRICSCIFKIFSESLISQT